MSATQTTPWSSAGLTGEQLKRHHQLSCGFAYPGTYGHECGAKAILAGSRKSDLTKSGIYWAKRCASCAAEKGGENAGITNFVPFNPDIHVNEFK